MKEEMRKVICFQWGKKQFPSFDGETGYLEFFDGYDNNYPNKMEK